MNSAMTFTSEVCFGRKRKGQRVLNASKQVEQPHVEPGRVPRVARLMALAIRFDQLLRDGEIASRSELAALGQVTRARVSQIMNLLNLTPDLQESLLFLTRIGRGRAPVILRDLQPIASEPDWRRQRLMWKNLFDGGRT